MTILRGSILAFLGLFIASSLFAQGRPDFDRGRGPRNPPNPEQLATNELTMIGRFLKLNAAQLSSLTGDQTLVDALKAEQQTLQDNAKALRDARKQLTADIIAKADQTKITADENAIGGLETSNLVARVTAATSFLSRLPVDSINLTSAQQTSVVQMLIGGGPGGPGGGFGPGR